MLFDVKMKMLYILFSGHCIASVLFPGYVFYNFKVITAESKVCLGECEFRDIGMEK